MMNKDRISPAELSIKDKKKTAKWQVIRVATFARSKVIHAKGAENENVYLIYYRNSLIMGDQLKEVTAGSFIDKAFHDGIVIESPHLIRSVLIPKQPVTIPNRNKVLSQLQEHYSPQEFAYIATTLDSFFPKDQLANLIDQIYFHYRRNGNFKKAFQILQILTEFMPAFKSAKERFSSRDYSSYHDLYHSASLPAIFQKDPLYVELYCCKNRFDPEIRSILEEIFKSQGCYDAVILLWLEKVAKSGKAEAVEDYTRMALKFVTMEEWVDILGQSKINPFQVLSEAKPVIENMIQKGNYEKAALSLMNFIDDLPASYDSVLKRLWENLDAEFVVAHLEDFIAILRQQVNEENQNQPESQIFQLVVSMLKGYDLKTVYEKLLPLKKVLPHSRVMNKLGKMVGLQEDPDRMMELGDDYAEFKQYDEAIECYSWEMELNPQDPDPVWKICKMYQQKGMVAEAAAYQKVFAQLKNNQETI